MNTRSSPILPLVPEKPWREPSSEKTNRLMTSKTRHGVWRKTIAGHVINSAVVLNFINIKTHEGRPPNRIGKVIGDWEFAEKRCLVACSFCRTNCRKGFCSPQGQFLNWGALHAISSRYSSGHNRHSGRRASNFRCKPVQLDRMRRRRHGVNIRRFRYIGGQVQVSHVAIS